MLKSKKRFFWGALVAFMLGVIVLILFGFAFRPDRFVYDSAYYWELAHQFTDEQGHLTWMAYPESFRGYVFPGFLFLSRVMSHWMGWADEVGFVVWAALFISFVVTIVLPHLLSWQESSRFDFLKRLAPLVLILIFWRGLVLYPLSDFYSLGFTLIACALFKWLYGQRRSWWQGIPAAMAIGVFLYAAYNTRTIYLFALVVFAILLAVRIVREGLPDLGKNALWLVCIAVGWFLLAAPQMLINHHHLGIWSFGVDTSMVDSSGLFSAQLYAGLICDRYDTLIKPNDFENAAALRFEDLVGWQILNTTGGYRICSIAEYFGLVFSHPLEVAGIYFRHVANLLNPVYGEMYIKDLHQIKLPYSIVNYVLMTLTYLGALQVFSMEYFGERNAPDGTVKKRFLLRKFLQDTALWWTIIFPCLTIIPGQPEIRFFFPVYLCMYAFLTFRCPWKNVTLYLRQHPVKTAFFALAGLVVLASVWSATFAKAQVTVDLFL